MKKSIRLVQLIAAAAALNAPTHATAEDVFIKFDGIDGEVTSKDHKGEIEVFSYSWGTSRGPSTPGDMRGSSSKGCVSEFSFMKQLDKSSTALVGNSMGGPAIPKVKVTVRRSGEVAQDYFTFELSNVLVSSYQMSASSERPFESIALRFSAAKMIYKPQDDKGSLGPATEVNLKVGNCS